MFERLLRTACTMLMVSLLPLCAMALPLDESTSFSHDGSGEELGAKTNVGSGQKNGNNAAIVPIVVDDGSGDYKERVFPDSVVLNSHSETLQIGDRFQLTAKVFPLDVIDDEVYWKSSNAEIANVTPSGLVTAYSRGTCMIYAVCQDKIDSCLITVEASVVYPEAVELSSHAETLLVGDRLQLTAKVFPVDVTDGTIFWKSSDDLVASVSPSGLVTAYSRGNCVVYAICQDKIDSCLITVDNPEVMPDSVVLSSHSATLLVNETVELSATVYPADVTDASVTWCSSDESVATVSAAGVVTALSPGTCVITATCQDKSDQCAITVEKPVIYPDSVVLSSHSATLLVNETVELSATVYPADVTDASVTWSSSDESVATVSAAGVVTALSPGTCVITATCQDKSDQCAIIVEKPVIYPDSVVLNTHSATLLVNETVELNATVYPADVTDSSVTWSSSDEAVATVSAAGVVTALSPGTCVITATCHDKSDQCLITVEKPVIYPDSVVLNSHSATLLVNETVELSATVYPADVTDARVTWSSSDESVATVSAAGVVTALSPGTCVITATCQNKSDQCAITVEKPVIYPDSVVLNSHSATLLVNETVELSATVYPADVTDASVTWSSSDESVATVSAAGVVTALSPGTCVITATCHDKSDQCLITVEKPVIYPDSVVLSSHSATLLVNETVELIATVYPADVTDSSVTWSSSDESVATVSAAGVVTAVSPGTCVITATCQDKSDQCLITVEKPVIYPDSVVLNSHSATLLVNETVELIATVYPADVTDASVTWSSSDESVATVSAAGVVTALSPGTCVITATCQDKSDQCLITVEKPVIYPDSVVLNSHSATLLVNETVELIATVYPADVTDASVTWSSSDESVATVSAAGVVTALSPGTCVITATCQDKSDQCLITVEKPVIYPDSVVLNSHSATLLVNETVELIATVYPADVTDSSVTWSSSDESVATVSAAGIVTAVSPGTCVITATCQDKSDQCLITVENQTVLPDSVVLSSVEAKLVIGDRMELTAQVHPEQVADPTILWASSDVEVATVQDGNVTALAKGECDIIATSGDAQGKCHIVVYSPSEVVITLNQGDAEMVINKTVELTPEFTPVPREFVVFSTNENVASAMIEDGVVKITGNGFGRATVRVESSDGEAQSDSCDVYVSTFLGDISGDGSVSISDITYLIDGLLSSGDISDPYFGDMDYDGSVAIADVTSLIDHLLSGTESIYMILPESVTLSVESASMAIGEKLTLDAIVAPDNTTNKHLAWMSSNTSVAKVTDGVVTATGSGTSDIIAVCRDRLAVCRIEVKEVLPESVALNHENLTLTPGQTAQLTATVSPTNTTDKTVTWSSSNKSIATVVNGKVTAKAVGECDIVADCQGVQGLCHVIVQAVTPQSVTLSMSEASMKVGDEITLTATVAPANTTDKTITWSSSNTTIATVQNGKVTAVAVGECDIIARCQNVQASCHVTVGEPAVVDENTFTVNGVTFVMVPVEPGTFMMGAPLTEGGSYTYEKPQHQVTLTKSYKIAQTEVTQELWEAVMNTNPSIFRGNPQRPVENMTWEACQEFIAKLNELTGANFRLPTEAEWEFAAIGGNLSQGYKYAGSNVIDDVAWYYSNSAVHGSDHPDYGPHAVGTKSPNELGLYDMCGNVWEWCNDWYSAYNSDSQVDPTGPQTGSYKVYRDGSWNSYSRECRLHYRYMLPITYHSQSLGLRLAL